MKKVLGILLLSLIAVISAVGFTACDISENAGNNNGNSNHMIDHKHVYEETIVEPSCTEQGYTLHICITCKDSYKDNYTNKLDHKFTDYVYDENATYSEDGTKTAVCDYGCGEKDTIIAENTKLKSAIEFKTLSVDNELNVYGKVPNTQSTFSFINEVEIKGNALFSVSTDIYGRQQIPTKTVPLMIGDNTFYITETVGNDIRLFTVTVRRRQIYNVTFDTDGVTAVSAQQIEEDFYAIEPKTTKNGYNFGGWDYDFNNAITADTVIKAKWEVWEGLAIFYFTSTEDSITITGIKDKSATKITVPNYVTSIGEEAFSWCSSLTSIEIPDSVTSIGYAAFRYCSSLTSVTIGNSVTCIGDYAFYNCRSLTSITIGNSVTYIGERSFYGCSSLTSIEIPDSVTSIGSCAFSNCSSLTSVTIPDSVTSIGDYAFSGCSSLQYNEYDNGYYLGNKNNPYIILIKTKTQDITACTIHSKTKVILNDAFYNCSSLKSIEIPDSVTSIGYAAFRYCSSLTSIEIPNSVTSIGYAAFSGCPCVKTNKGLSYVDKWLIKADNAITSATIKEDTVGIAAGAFADCSSLTSVVIPESVTSIGYGVFSNCSSLTSITIPDRETYSWGITKTNQKTINKSEIIASSF